MGMRLLRMAVSAFCLSAGLVGLSIVIVAAFQPPGAHAVTDDAAPDAPQSAVNRAGASGVAFRLDAPGDTAGNRQLPVDADDRSGTRAAR